MAKRDYYEVLGIAKSATQDDIKKAFREIAKKHHPDRNPDNRESEEVLKFTKENLDDFSVGTKGLTFLYDAGYPHAIQAFEPNGRYFFSYSQLKPYIKRDGLLGQFVE